MQLSPYLFAFWWVQLIATASESTTTTISTSFKTHSRPTHPLRIAMAVARKQGVIVVGVQLRVMMGIIKRTGKLQQRRLIVTKMVTLRMGKMSVIMPINRIILTITQQNHATQPTVPIKLM